MYDLSHIGFWDVLLLAVVPVQATAIAYLHAPGHKALVLTLPVPFTIATLAVGKPVNATNVLGLLLLLAFTHGVNYFHNRLRVPIMVSIVACALAYCAAGAALVPVVPKSSAAFWTMAGGVFIVALWAYAKTPHRVEPGHRSPMPVWTKFPIVFGVVLGLVAMKSILAGFMTLFPMLGVITAYEARHSLWTICRQVPVIMLTILPMLVVIHVSGPYVGLAIGLVAGWIVFLGLLVLFMKLREV